MTGVQTCALPICFPVTIFIGYWDKQTKIDYELLVGDGVFLFVVGGIARIGEKMLFERDSVQITDTKQIEIELFKDSMGHKSVLSAPSVQKMSAGTGIFHSEFNASADEELKLFQIWIRPESKGLTPVYEQIRLKKRTFATVY